MGIDLIVNSVAAFTLGAMASWTMQDLLHGFPPLRLARMSRG